MINEKLVFMTNNKLYYKRKLINADDSKVNEKVALYSLVFGSVGVAVNVFSIDNEH